MEELDIISQIFNKSSFKELSDSERSQISEWVNDEESFKEMKLMLSAVTKDITEAEEITPKSEIKEALLSEFKKVNQKSKSFYLFPKNTPVIKMPGVQILMAAAVFVLIFMVYSNQQDNITESNQLAVNELPKNNLPIVTEDSLNEVVDDNEDSKIEINDQENQLAEVEEKTLVELEESVPSKEEVFTKQELEEDGVAVTNDNSLDHTYTKDVDDALNKSASNSNQYKTTTGNSDINSLESVSYDYEEIAEEYLDEDNSIEELAETQIITETSSAPSSARAETTMSLKKSDAKETATSFTSKSLAADKELIQYFYTAM